MVDLAYKFKGSGHEVPEERRKYDKVDSKLAAEFEKWLKKPKNEESISKSLAERLTAIISGRDLPQEEVHALILKYQDHPNILETGTFLTFLYNQAKDDVIVFDVLEGIEYLGRDLQKGKCLVNLVKNSQGVGSHAEGDIINYAGNVDTSVFTIGNGDGVFLNYADADELVNEKGLCINAGNLDKFGYDNGKIIVNLGRASELGLNSTSDSTLINAGEADLLGDESNGRIIVITEPKKYGNVKDAKFVAKDCKPELVKYFDSLRERVEAGRKDYNIAVKLVRSLSVEKMEKDLEEMLGEVWW